MFVLKPRTTISLVHVIYKNTLGIHITANSLIYNIYMDIYYYHVCYVYNKCLYDYIDIFMYIYITMISFHAICVKV